jgi:transcriptional regulator with XRE-family HTH domain
MRPARLNAQMTTSSRYSKRTAVGRRTHEIVAATGADIKTMRMDAGLSQRRLAEAAAIDHGFLSQVERGVRAPSLAVLVAISSALGGDLRVRVYPGTGPRVRDPLQARMVEAILRELHPRWARHLEVPVYRPVHGVIDLVVHDPVASVIGATEVQSELRRLEQQIRWSHEKADALPSAAIWRFAEPWPKVDRLLIVRNTRTNRAIVERFAATLTTEYPARTIDVYRSLTTADAPWPGSAILWVSVDGDVAKVLEHPPRGVKVGR